MFATLQFTFHKFLYFTFAHEGTFFHPTFDAIAKLEAPLHNR